MSVMSDERRNHDRGRNRHDGVLGDRRYIDDGRTARVAGGLGYIGQGNFSSGDYSEDEGSNDYDYDYAGFKGDVGIDEYGDELYGGGRYGQGPFEQSQQFGGSGFGTGQGPFGSLQRQYENRFVAGGHRGSYGDRFGYPGRDDHGSKALQDERRFWRDDTGNRRVDERAYYSAVSDDERDWRSRASYTGFSELPNMEPFSPREFRGLSDWHGAPDYADPRGYQVFDTGDDRNRDRPARRGPKGYRRSDERIAEEIYLQLLRAQHVDSSDVSVEVHDGEATLTGTVPERRMKHAIENIIDGIRDVRGIDNRIRVRARHDERRENRNDENRLRPSSASS
jgi:osmotically-inducible protein OsmY